MNYSLSYIWLKPTVKKLEVLVVIFLRTKSINRISKTLQYEVQVTTEASCKEQDFRSTCAHIYQVTRPPFPVSTHVVQKDTMCTAVSVHAKQHKRLPV